MMILRQFILLATAGAGAAAAQTTIRAGTMIDGRGGVRRDVIITVEGSRISSIAAAGTSRATVTHDLREFTVLPGLIDTHVHLESHFGADGRAQSSGETPAQRLHAAADNAYSTLMAGYTTVQSLGSPLDTTLRRLIRDRGTFGPRILTSIRSLTDTSLSPAAIREWVRATAGAGADVIKVFASRSIREGGGQTLAEEQIRAACEEARALGLRTWIHAHAASAASAAARARCHAVTHGSQLTNDVLRELSAAATWFEPNIGLVSQNYIENKARYIGIGNYDEAGFRFMEEGIPRKLEMFKRALQVPGLRLIGGTDATAGAHGSNAREVIYRVRTGGQTPAAALAGVTSLAAASLGLADSIGSLAPGMVADLIATRGNPLSSIESLRDIMFVMQGGRVVLERPAAFTLRAGEALEVPTFTNAAADYDGDGDADLFIGLNGQPNRLLQNDGGVFRDVAGAWGVADARATRSAAWGDYDGDGDIDLLVGFVPGARSLLQLYRNGGGSFTDVTREVGLAVDSGAVRQPAWVDFDGDGDLDLFVAFRDRANMLFRNDGGRFAEIAATVGVADPRRSVGALWFDYDSDGDLDLYVANQDGDANGLFRNDGGRFTDVAQTAGAEWAGRRPGETTNGTVRPCAADVNGDGRLDLFGANYGRNGLLINRGNGSFEDASSQWGVDIDARHDACAFEDFDNDGRIDLYVNGTVTGGVSYRDYLLRNTGSTFVNATPAAIGALPADHGVVWLDADGDGDMDLSLTGVALRGTLALVRNSLPASQARRSLRVRVVDSQGHATRAGTEVRLFAAGTDRLLGMRLVDTGSGYNSQSDLPLHFGVPGGGPVDVQVIWPAGGERRETWVRRVSPGAAGALTIRAR
ncbi:MAG: FG-GAP-like repeat-containing protein [Gemmatimonadota bacterium]